MFLWMQNYYMPLSSGWVISIVTAISQKKKKKTITLEYHLENIFAFLSVLGIDATMTVMYAIKRASLEHQFDFTGT